MKLIMVSGDRSVLRGNRGAFWYTLQELHGHFDRIDVICPHVPFASMHQEFNNVFFHPCPKGLWYQPFWIKKKGEELIKLFGHTAMTVHDYPPFYNGLGAMMLHTATKIPYAIEIHHVVGFPRAGSFTEFIGKWMTQLFIGLDTKHAAAVRVVNDRTGDLLARWGVASSKIKTVPSLYLDHETLKPNHSIEKTYDIAFAGRLVANKELNTLLRAMKKIPDATLLVIGDGPLKRLHEMKARQMKIENRVTFAGWMAEQSDVAKAIQSAKIFVMCSKSEGGPRVLFEAMALGMPVVATPVGLVPDIVEDDVNGRITDGSVDNMAHIINGLLQDDRIRVRLGQSAESILHRFERTTGIANYAHFLQTIA